MSNFVRGSLDSLQKASQVCYHVPLLYCSQSPTTKLPAPNYALERI